MAKVQLQALLTCPKCGFIAKETMVMDTCQYFYQCKNCREILRPLNKDCCVFCSYADVPCPPVQSQSGLKSNA